MKSKPTSKAPADTLVRSVGTAFPAQDDLLACPFCGVIPEIINPFEESPSFTKILCISASCVAWPKVYGADSEIARQKWNTRAGAQGEQAPGATAGGSEWVRPNNDYTDSQK